MARTHEVVRALTSSHSSMVSVATIARDARLDALNLFSYSYFSVSVFRNLKTRTFRYPHR